jgi:hypothetical protein
MLSRKVVVSISVGALFVTALAAAAQKLGVTDVRVGPTAAISVATSADGNIVYVAHGNGVYKSTDGGEKWRKLPVE